MKLRLTAVVLLISLLVATLPGVAGAASPARSGTRVAALAAGTGGVTNLATIPISGTTQSGGVFTGTFDLMHFGVQKGQLVAEGVLTGTLTNSAGKVLGTVSGVPVAIPV